MDSAITHCLIFMTITWSFFDYYEHNMSLAMVVREVPYELPTKNIFADVSHDKSEVEE